MVTMRMYSFTLSIHLLPDLLAYLFTSLLTSIYLLLFYLLSTIAALDFLPKQPVSFTILETFSCQNTAMNVSCGFLVFELSVINRNIYTY